MNPAPGTILQSSVLQNVEVTTPLCLRRTPRKRACHAHDRSTDRPIQIFVSHIQNIRDKIRGGYIMSPKCMATANFAHLKFSVNPALAHGLHYGTGVFEGIRAYDATRACGFSP